MDNDIPNANVGLSFVNAPDAAGPSCDIDGHCVTCSDEALPARVLQVDEVTGLAIVEVEGATAEVDVTLVDEIQVGQVLLVHGGVAIGLLEDES